MIKLSAGEVSVDLSLKYYESIIEANLKNIFVYDLTNYPYTVYNKSNAREITARVLVDGNETHNEINLTVKLLSDACPSIRDGIKSMADVKIYNLTINYTH